MTKMSELNRELLLDELSNFEQKKSGEIPVILDKYLESIAQNGDTMFSWIKLQPLLRRKLEIVMNEFNDLCPTDHLIPLPNVRPFDFEELKQQILTAIDTFCSAPFTVQRICELITNPSKHYKRTDKFMRGIEKNILVVTTVEPKSSDGSSTQYQTSSFKNLFSSLHSSSSNSSSLTTPSTSLLVNGMTEVMCDQQIAIHCSNDTDLHQMSSPVSPNSMPMTTSSTTSPQTTQLAPLQQLDSFTTVFATTPSTPLSVVSDIHTYEHSSSLPLITSSTSIDNSTTSNSSASSSSETKTTETTYFEPTLGLQTDSVTLSSNNLVNAFDNSLQTNPSGDTNSETKVDFNRSVSNQESNESKQMDSNQNMNESKNENQLLKETTNKSNETSDKSNDNNIEIKEILENETKITENLSDSSLPIEENSSETKIIKTDNSSERLECDTPLSSTENKPPVEELVKVSQSNKNIENIDNNNEMRITTDEEMSQPMDDFNGNNGNNADGNQDMTDCSERTNEPTADVMEHSSDLPEPMDED